MKEQCQHDINISEHTILLSKRTNLVHPICKCGVCEICGASLKYKKENDIFIIIEEAEHEHFGSDLQSIK